MSAELTETAVGGHGARSAASLPQNDGDTRRPPRAIAPGDASAGVPRAGRARGASTRPSWMPRTTRPRTPSSPGRRWRTLRRSSRPSRRRLSSLAPDSGRIRRGGTSRARRLPLVERAVEVGTDPAPGASSSSARVLDGSTSPLYSHADMIAEATVSLTDHRRRHARRPRRCIPDAPRRVVICPSPPAVRGRHGQSGRRAARRGLPGGRAGDRCASTSGASARRPASRRWAATSARRRGRPERTSRGLVGAERPASRWPATPSAPRSRRRRRAATPSGPGSPSSPRRWRPGLDHLGASRADRLGVAARRRGTERRDTVRRGPLERLGDVAPSAVVHVHRRRGPLLLRQALPARRDRGRLGARVSASVAAKR